MPATGVSPALGLQHGHPVFIGPNSTAIVSIPITETSDGPDHHSVPGLERQEFRAYAFLTESAGDLTTAFLPDTFSACYTSVATGRKEEDVCVYPAGELSTFVEWQDNLATPEGEPLVSAAFNGTLLPVGWQTALYSTPAAHPSVSNYLHTVREQTGSSDVENTCLAILTEHGLHEEAAVEKFCNPLLGSNGVTGGEWPLHPRATGTPVNLWGHLIPGDYGEFDQVQFNAWCPSVLAYALRVAGEPSCTVEVAQQMQYQCRLGNAGVDSAGKIIRPSGDWYVPYADQKISININVGSGSDPDTLTIIRGTGFLSASPPLPLEPWENHFAP